MKAFRIAPLLLVLVMSPFVLVFAAPRETLIAPTSNIDRLPNLKIFGYAMSYLPLDAAYAVNNAGAICGKLGANAAVYAQGATLVLLGKNGYSNLQAIDIANNGYIVGTGENSGARRPLFWQSTQAAPLDMSALGQFTTPTAVNSQGTVVGYYQTSADALPQAFRWAPNSGMQVITPSGASTAQAFDISETGYIAGHAQYFGIGQQVVRWNLDGSPSRINATGHADRALDDGRVFGLAAGIGAAIWDLHNMMTPLGPKPSTHVVTQHSATNRLVGYTVGEPFGPLPWTTINNSSVQYLPIPTGAIGFAYDVNACGTIIGSVTLADGTQRAVMWTRLICDRPPIIVASP